MMGNDTERKGFFDKLFASGKDALSLKNIVVRLVLMLVFGIVLNGWRSLIVLINAHGFRGVGMSYWQGVTKSLSSVWFGFSNFDSLSSLGGSKIALFFILAGLLVALSPFFKTLLDIFDFQKGEALGFVAVTLVTLLSIAVLGFAAFSAGVSPDLLGVDVPVDSVVDVPVVPVGDDDSVVPVGDNDSVVPDLVATINMLG